MKTKERIIHEALTLFSKKGYKGTSVKDIAAAVGIKDSSIYKHFKSKQEILDAIMLTINKRVEELPVNFGFPTGEDYESAAGFYAALNKQSLIELSTRIFLFYLHDDLISKFWRMGVMEQFHNEQIYELFRQLFLEASIKYQTTLFKEMIRQKVFIKADPQVMAMSFYTTFFFLLSKYSGREDSDEEALEILQKQVGEFYRIYKRK